ncbi:MAG: DUF934 domain-containing protein [Pseudohongiella sp.]|nr:DUF934 domain-containing protein [Pseudohongiella sp.]
METKVMTTRLIKNGTLVSDNWVLLGAATDRDAVAAMHDRDVIVPLSFWLSEQDLISARPSRTAVWLNSNETPEAIAGSLDKLALVALNFPEFKDGRPYSIARELRQRFAYTGEIRAIGDVLRDQLFFMRRCGFNAFALRDDQDIDVALTAFNDFTDAYQPAIDQPLPLFRRR